MDKETNIESFSRNYVVFMEVTLCLIGYMNNAEDDTNSKPLDTTNRIPLEAEQIYTREDICQYIYIYSRASLEPERDVTVFSSAYENVQNLPQRLDSLIL